MENKKHLEMWRRTCNFSFNDGNIDQPFRGNRNTNRDHPEETQRPW